MTAAAEALLSRLELFGIRLGLETTHRLLATLGHPERGLPAVLVAGTNGKGSTSALLAAMVQAAGYRTGLYTSPHLEDVEERVRLDGEAIPGERLSAYLEEVVAASEQDLGHSPTYFEALTAAAFLAFREAKVDLAVLEVGLGGRLDATNAALPVLSVITPIGLDHTDRLGNTLAAIAREKAGILRPDRPAVVAPSIDVMGGEAEAAIRAAATALGTPLHVLADEVTIDDPEPAALGPRVVGLRTPQGNYHVELGLLGAHQATNLALAVRAAEILAGLGWERLDAVAIAVGAARCRWPGRLERIELPADAAPNSALGSVLLDGAHNPAGAAALAAFLAAAGRPYDLLFGAFADKEVGGMLPALAAGARRVTLTRAPGSRGLDPAELARLLPPGRPFAAEPELAAALDRALVPDPSGAGLLVVTGSLFLVGAARQALRARFGVPTPAVAPLFETDLGRR